MRAKAGVRRASLGLVCGIGLLLSACGQGDELGDVTAARASSLCHDRARSAASVGNVRTTVTRKQDRYWQVLLGVGPPQNLVSCTVNAVTGDVVTWNYGYTRRAAEDALRGGLWDDSGKATHPGAPRR